MTLRDHEYSSRSLAVTALAGILALIALLAMLNVITWLDDTELRAPMVTTDVDSRP